MVATNAAEKHSEADSSRHELDSPPWLRVEGTLMATANAIRSVYDERMAVLDLTLSQASLVSYVADFGPVSQTRAAEHLDQGRAVTGTHIDKLEERGLIERRPDPADRRVWLIAITAAGLDVSKSIAELDVVLRSELRSGISRPERQALAGLLLRLQRNIAAARLSAANDVPHPQTPHGEPT